MRASSSDPNWRNGNMDARPIPAGGTLVLADLIGARTCILVKDEKGLFADDPKKTGKPFSFLKSAYGNSWTWTWTI